MILSCIYIFFYASSSSSSSRAMDIKISDAIRYTTTVAVDYVAVVIFIYNIIINLITDVVFFFFCLFHLSLKNVIL